MEKKTKKFHLFDIYASNYRSLGLIILAVSVLLALFSFVQLNLTGIEEAPKVPPLNKDTYFREFSLPTYDRTGTITNEDLKGHKLTMINIWGTFCGPCAAEMPDLDELDQKYRDRGFQIIGLCGDVWTDEGYSEQLLADGQKVLDSTGVHYLQAIADEQFSQGFLQYHVSAYPTSYFVDEEGNTLVVLTGNPGVDKYVQVIETLLAKSEAKNE